MQGRDKTRPPFALLTPAKKPRMAGVLPPVIGSNLRLHGAACAAIAPNACLVHHLGASQLSFDSTIGAAKMAVRFRESLEARLWPDGLVADALCAEVWPNDSATPPPGAALLTLGHQQDAHGAMPCPAIQPLTESLWFQHSKRTSSPYTCEMCPPS